MRIRPLLILLLISFGALIHLHGAVTFHDNFQRPDGPAGSGWTADGSSIATIESGKLRLDCAGGDIIYHQFSPVTENRFQTQFEFNFESLTDTYYIFSEEICTRLLFFPNGQLHYDWTENVNDHVPIGSFNLGQWYTLRMEIDIANNSFSVWLDNALLAESIVGQDVSAISQVKFRVSQSGTAILWLDDYLLGEGELYEAISAPVTLDNQAPTMQIVSPNGGEEWCIGETIDILWSAEESHPGDLPVTLSWSRNGGTDYIHLTDTGNTETWAWQLPTVVTSTAMVKAVITDAFGNTCEDTGDGLFSIVYVEPATPENVGIDLSNDRDAIITWDPVTTSVNDTPITPDGYIVRFCEMPEDEGYPYYFLGLSPDTTFTHPDVVQHSDNMFYRVTAWIDHEERVVNLLSAQRKENDFLYQGEPITWEEFVQRYVPARKIPGGEK